MDLGAVDCRRLAAGAWVTQRILACQTRLDAFGEAVAQIDRRAMRPSRVTEASALPSTTAVGMEQSSALALAGDCYRRKAFFAV